MKICHPNWFTRKCYSIQLKIRMLRMLKILIILKIYCFMSFRISERIMRTGIWRLNLWKTKKFGNRKMGGVFIQRNIRKESWIMWLFSWDYNWDLLLKVQSRMQKNSSCNSLRSKSIKYSKFCYCRMIIVLKNNLSFIINLSKSKLFIKSIL